MDSEQIQRASERIWNFELLPWTPVPVRVLHPLHPHSVKRGKGTAFGDQSTVALVSAPQTTIITNVRLQELHVYHNFKWQCKTHFPQCCEHIFSICLLSLNTDDNFHMYVIKILKGKNRLSGNENGYSGRPRTKAENQENISIMHFEYSEYKWVI